MASTESTLGITLDPAPGSHIDEQEQGQIETNSAVAVSTKTVQ